ncbi:Uncharacterised protein [Candidatus Burarchaeum australiense]|nr:Uncharacterised protein [Candidatus Burarchaeum australiense]
MRTNLLTTGSIDSFYFAEAYTNEIAYNLSVFTGRMEETAIGVGAVSSTITYCQILGSTAGFSIASCKYLGATQGTLGVALTALSSATIAMQAQWLLLEAAKQIFVLLFPVGVLLRTIKFTRAVGGAMMAVAIGLYIVYPLMVMADYSMVAKMIFVPTLKPPNPPVLPPYATISIPPAPTSFNGVCSGDVAYRNMLTNRHQFIEPMAYWVIIVSILLPVMNLLVTLTFIRWFASFLGSEIEVSQLARVV